jgi:hypothetical protein
MKYDDLLPTRDDVIQFAREQCDFAEKRLTEKPDSIMPQLFINAIDETGQKGSILCAIAMPFNEDQEKRSALDTIGKKLYSDKQAPVMVALTTEAWLAHDPPPGIEPRHFYGRKECVIVAAVDVQRKFCALGSIPVKRVQNRMEKDGELTFSTEGVKFPLLNHFFNGFFSTLAAKMAKEESGKGFPI